MEIERGLFRGFRPEYHLSTAPLLPDGCSRLTSKRPQVLHRLCGTFSLAPAASDGRAMCGPDLIVAPRQSSNVTDRRCRHTRHRHRLLRPHGEWPRRRATHQADELPPVQLFEWHQSPASQTEDARIALDGIGQRVKSPWRGAGAGGQPADCGQPSAAHKPGGSAYYRLSLSIKA
jgi:hypothetical protein